MNTTERAISRFSDPVKRNCYTDDEFELSHYSRENGYRYSMNNCMYESLMQKTLFQCNCTPQFYLTSGTQLPLAEMCTGESLGCYYKVKRHAFNEIPKAIDRRVSSFHLRAASDRPLRAMCAKTAAPMQVACSIAAIWTLISFK